MMMMMMVEQGLHIVIFVHADCVRADVVLICFSVVYPRSLRSIYKHWMVEAEHYCPGVPVVVCGCQVDLRHLYNDPVFLALDKGPFFRFCKIRLSLALLKVLEVDYTFYSGLDLLCECNKAQQIPDHDEACFFCDRS